MWIDEVLSLLDVSTGREVGPPAHERAEQILRSHVPFPDLVLPAARRLAALCESSGLAAFALAAHQRVLELEPTDVAARRGAAELLRERGDLEAANAHIEMLPGLDPGGDDLRTEPNPGDAAFLHELYTQTGSSDRAEALIARLRRMQAPELSMLADQLEAAAASPDDGWFASSGPEPEGTAGNAAEDPIPAAGSWVGPSDSDLVRMMQLFSAREGIYARQWWNEGGQGGYSPVREPVTPRVLQNHIFGNITVGVYPVRQDGTSLFFALDLDIGKKAIERVRAHPREARDLKSALHVHCMHLAAFFRESGIEPLLEDSGYKGRHLWVFLKQPETCDVLFRLGVRLGLLLRPDEPDLHLEFFPKQPKVAPTGVGNLIKLPLGIHRRTGRRSAILDAEGLPVREPFRALRAVVPATQQQLYDLIERARKLPLPPDRGRRSGGSAAAAAGTGGGEADDDLFLEHPPGGELGTAGRAGRSTGPAPPEPPPAWTEADFERDSEVQHLLANCPVLERLRDQVSKMRKLSHDERVVLLHVLGHRPTGLLAVNYLLERCVNVPETERLQTQFSGNPISCPKIRKRIPEVTSHLDCNCDFSFSPDHYPTPLLHLLTMAPSEPKSPTVPEIPVGPESDPSELGRRLGVLQERSERLVREASELRRSLAALMERRGMDRLQYDNGAFLLRREAGEPPVLEWVDDRPPVTDQG